jgi:oligopeptide/dipeptide ABC transporter ATP-binding protein
LLMPEGKDTVPLLAVKRLVTHFHLAAGTVKAVDGVDLTVHPGEIVTVVGESGSGKTVTALSVMRLIERPGRIESGEIMLHGRDLLRLSARQMHEVRGRKIGMIFQNPYTALHPYFRIGLQMEETLVVRGGKSKEAAHREAAALLERVQVEEPERVMRSFAHEVSAGVCQRVMLALALSLQPELLIADEPTTNLDAISQREILELIKEMRDHLGMGILLITHDFGIVRHMANTVLVMYAGRPVEYGPASCVLSDPLHPYTRGLIRSARTLVERRERLDQIPGEVPDLMLLPIGCSFRPRCPLAGDDCTSAPPVVRSADGRVTLCWRAVRQSKMSLQ